MVLFSGFRPGLRYGQSKDGLKRHAGSDVCVLFGPHRVRRRVSARTLPDPLRKSGVSLAFADDLHGVEEWFSRGLGHEFVRVCVAACEEGLNLNSRVGANLVTMGSLDFL